MQTSAPGKAEAGFTLVELLVVLLIIGMTAGLTVMAVPRGQSDLARLSGRIEQDVAAMRDAALAETTFYGIGLTPGAYVRLEGGEGGWREMDRRVIPETVTLEIVPREGWALPEHRGEIPLGIDFPEEDGEGLVPTIVFAPEGSVTPFAVRLRQGGNEALVRVGPFGEIGDRGDD